MTFPEINTIVNIVHNAIKDTIANIHPMQNGKYLLELVLKNITVILSKILRAASIFLKL